MTGTDSVDDPGDASFRQRFKPREVRGVTVLMVAALGAEGDVSLDIGVRQSIGTTGNRGFVCDFGGFPSEDLDAGLDAIVRCYSTIGRAGGALCYLRAQRFIDYNEYVAKYCPLPLTFEDEASAVTYVLDRVEHGYPEGPDKILWRLRKTEDVALVVKRTLVPGVQFELRVSVCGVLRHSAVYEDLTELVVVANGKREELIAAGWVDAPPH